MSRLVRRAIAGTVLAFGVLGFATPSVGASDGHTITGDMTLTVDGGWFASQTTCDGVGGYHDITAGAQVVVRNSKGKTIAVGSLAKGALDKFSVDRTGTFKDTCVFPLRVKNVPDSDFYSIEVAHRGELNYPKKKLEKAKWKVHLTLGS